MPNLGASASGTTISPRTKNVSFDGLWPMGPHNKYMALWDFLRFVDALRKCYHLINGDFVNCFPLGEYFNSTRRNDIRFGRREEMGNDSWDLDDQMMIYTRWQYEQMELWWDPVRKDLWPTMKDLVLRWNVQINLILKAWSSGAFAKTIRVLSWTNPIFMSTPHPKTEPEIVIWDQGSVPEPIQNSPFGGSVCENSWINEGPRRDLDARKTTRSSRLTRAVLCFLSRGYHIPKICFRIQQLKG